MPENYRGELVYNNPKENLEKEEEPLHTFDLVLNGKIIGRAEITYLSKPFPLYQINELFVEHEHQGVGYSSKIMDQVEAFLKKKKKAGVLVDAILPSSQASGMYARRGWLEIPGGLGLMVYNLPKNSDLKAFNGYASQYTDIMERDSFKKTEGLNKEIKS